MSETGPSAFSDDEIVALQAQLEAIPAPLEALDVSAVDGFLCGLLLQPEDIDEATWLAYVTDVDGRALPPAFDSRALVALVQRRHAELLGAIARRSWFDPWVFVPDDDAAPSKAVAPWVAGFAIAMELFPGLMGIDDARLLEPLALLYQHFDAEDLEDADALRSVIETLEPPADIGEAVQDLVRSVMLIADVVRPRSASKPGHRTAGGTWR